MVHFFDIPHSSLAVIISLIYGLLHTWFRSFLSQDPYYVGSDKSSMYIIWFVFRSLSSKLCRRYKLRLNLLMKTYMVLCLFWPKYLEVSLYGKRVHGWCIFWYATLKFGNNLSQLASAQQTTSEMANLTKHHHRHPKLSCTCAQIGQIHPIILKITVLQYYNLSQLALPTKQLYKCQTWPNI